jgi:tRNA pseudouridine55 synthase
MSRKPDPTVWRDLHGILLLDKPQGYSSNQALQTAKRIFRAEKAGHTGSLDPLATGLLPLCFGEATKIAGLLLGASKAYSAELKLGITTATGDAEGEVLRERPVPELSSVRIEAAMAPLRGRIVQIPPKYSAIKQGGERLYDKARRGEDVVVPAREVDVHRFELTGRDGHLLRVEVECGSGTYIRSLAVDLGEALGCGAHLTALRRDWVEPFRTPRMVSLDELGALSAAGDAPIDALLLPIEEGLVQMPAIAISEQDAARMRQGQVLSSTEPEGIYRVLAPGSRLIALGAVDMAGVLRVKRGLHVAKS